MSTRQVVGPVIVGRISPAAVSIEKTSESVQPRRRRYRIASRAPLPDSSASEPSGLKIVSRATKPGSSGARQQQDPVGEDAEVAGADARTRAGVSANGSSRCLDHDVVVAERLPLLELSCGAAAYRLANLGIHVGSSLDAHKNGATEHVPIFADFNLGDALLTVLAIFFTVIWIWILITVLVDLFRDHELSGWVKAVWVFFLVFLPVITVADLPDRAR